MKRTVAVFFLLVVAVPLLASGCGGDGEAPSPAVTVELPQGFPEDFPLWDKAAISVAGEAPGGAQGQGYVVGLESKESAEVARAFYEDALDVEPWQVDNVQEIQASDVVPPSPESSPAASPEPSAPAETTIIEFSRTDGSQTGTLAISEMQTNGRQTIIAVSLTVPR